MNNEKAFNILRGITMASYLENKEKRELLDWLNNLENEVEGNESK